MNRKMKSVSSLRKRVKKTATGKYLHRHGGTSHNNGSKTTRRKRALHAPVTATKTQSGRFKQLVPYK